MIKAMAIGKQKVESGKWKKDKLRVRQKVQALGTEVR